MRLTSASLCLASALLTLPLAAWAAEPATSNVATDRPAGQLIPVFAFHDQMPTGITVTRDGRRFASYPRWGDGNAFTVAELKDGREIPWPSKAINRPDIQHPNDALISVQSVVAPGDGNIWLLDTGTLPDKGYAASGQVKDGPKLVAVRLADNTVVRTLPVPPEAATATTYLNDVRFDFSKGKAGVAYMTDSSFTGPGAIIVMDLASGDAWRVLDGHPSTQADPAMVPIVEGRRMTATGKDGQQVVRRVPADGIALSPDGSTLYYSALTGRHLYSVPTATLLDRHITEEEAARTVTDLGEKGASDGMIMDNSGHLYATDYEHNAIHRLDTRTGDWSTIAHDPRLLWPDTLSIGPDGVYVTANQLHRQAAFNQGRDLRQPPYMLYRLDMDAEPVAPENR
ncbi:L-dopachrome tautomerase-related protein [Larsenimonas rhizosphaerae]|uniref:SMP-30/gluconolactonase/LRE family protein n=1 Tax=Larsenimonas rhizosphaerae TaxID=2944682 RepID=A0AA41ZNM4_9GAMM|nr:L-dopachrome tautomerase-related protein [Larsenimonas rhizosphaerae]MCX2524250.1 SMP-30/gluconolactonase/LRE family protein [Larsenimonas rhizosphaerae]